MWGIAWLVILVSVEGLLVMAIFGSLYGNLQLRGEGADPAATVLAWLFAVPLCAWLFFMFPFTMLSQTALAFVASALSTRPTYSDVQIVEFVGSARYSLMEPVIETRAFRLVTAIGELGTRPGLIFALSAMALTAGIGLVMTVPSAVADFAGVGLVIVGAGGSVIGIRDRVNAELKKPQPRRGAPTRLTEKYYKGLRYRENKRARDLQKARDAGRAGTEPGALERWGKAEAEHAMREYNMAASNARKGVPGALDAAFELVFSNMDGAVTRKQAEQLVIDAAAFRGKKPVPVPADSTITG